jgi:acyl-CoA thioesterase-1
MRIAALICSIVFCAILCGCSKENAPVNAPKIFATPVSMPGNESAKPAIIAFGDSLTAGFGLADPQKSYPSLLQDSLAREGFDYQVTNLGLSGDTSAGGLKRLWLALKYKNVRVFILELGANDVVKKIPAVEIKPNLAEIIKQVKASGAKVILCGIAAPSSLGDEYGLEIREMYAELAKEYDLPLIPDFMQDVRENSELMLDDGIHPNEKGAEIIEQNVLPVVKTLLAKNDDSHKTHKK